MPLILTCWSVEKNNGKINLVYIFLQTNLNPVMVLFNHQGA